MRDIDLFYQLSYLFFMYNIFLLNSHMYFISQNQFASYINNTLLEKIMKEVKKNYKIYIAIYMNFVLYEIKNAKS